MGKIKLLPDHEIQKIAAGEVVDRPTNIVKELLENSIDAQSSHITLYIEDGGKQLIRVTDNGFGMNIEDAHLCIACHTTSKINGIDDLATINSYGFRGEAMASITAVSRTTIMTQEPQNTHGIKLAAENGKIYHEEPCVLPHGTDVIVQDLFYNIPARKKFLRTTSTETHTIIQLFQAITLAHTKIHFKFYSDHKLLYNCPPVPTYKDRMIQLYDTVHENHFININELDQTSHITVSGVISSHQHMRYDRTQLFVFVNNRWIKNYKLTHAILKGYDNVLPASRYPTAALFITINPHEIDINVHPRKEEVHFLQPRRVENLITQAVKRGLEYFISPEQKITSLTTANSLYIPSIPNNSFYNEKNSMENMLQQLPVVEPKQYIQEKSQEKLQDTNIYQKIEKQVEHQAYITPELLQHTEQRSYHIIGQLIKTYILIEQDNNLMLIDAHAAHERILYEQFAYKLKDIATTTLLFPEIVHLSLEDTELITQYIPLFKQYGITLDPFGQKEFIVSTAPISLKHISFSELIKQAIAFIKEHQIGENEHLFSTITEKIRALMACKAAVKAGDSLSMPEIYQLVDDLQKSNNKLTCPHGRPTSWIISATELEKKFKRKA